MKHLILLLTVVGAAASAQDKPPRLIVRGDDMGAAHAINEAIIRCHQEGIQSSIEIIVPSPWFPEAVRMLAEHPTADVGVHLALTSEWDNIKWRPLSDCPSLKDGDGYFHPMIHPNKNYPGRALREQQWTLADVEGEFRAQIELAKKHIPQLSHLTGHMGCTSLSEDVTVMTRKLAVEYRLDVFPEDLNVRTISYTGPRATSAEKIDSFIRTLDTLEAGRTYLFVDHPGLDTPEMRAIHHIGYEDVAADRQGVTDLWTNSSVRAAVQKRQIQLIGYRDLLR